MFSVSPIPTLSLHHSDDDSGVLQSLECRPFIFQVPLGTCGNLFTLCVKRDMIILENSTVWWMRRLRPEELPLSHFGWLFSFWYSTPLHSTLDLLWRFGSFPLNGNRLHKSYSSPQWSLTFLLSTTTCDQFATLWRVDLFLNGGRQNQ